MVVRLKMVMVERSIRGSSEGGVVIVVKVMLKKMAKLSPE